MTKDSFTRETYAGALPAWHIFLLFLRLGLTSFGGPAAHLGFFHDEFVKRRRWLSDAAYGEVVALCQLLPGPASSQVGLTLGFLQRGYRGAAAAWLGFTLPSALLMTLFALGLGLWPDAGQGGWITGLKLFVVAVVAQAVWQMGKTLCPDAPRLSIAVVVAVVLLMAGAAWMQILVLLAAGAAGAAMHLPQKRVEEALTIPVQPRRPMVFLVVFSALLLLAFLPLAEGSLGWIGSELYRAGALVFGGGHVVLPWLQGALWCQGTCRRIRFWPVMVWPRPCQARCLLSQRFWEPLRAAGQVLPWLWSLFFCREPCWYLPVYPCGHTFAAIRLHGRPWPG